MARSSSGQCGGRPGDGVAAWEEHSQDARSRWRYTGVLGVYAAVLGSVRWGYAAVLGNRTVGEQRGCMAVLGCPPDPSNNSEGAWGHLLAPVTN